MVHSRLNPKPKTIGFLYENWSFSVAHVIAATSTGPPSQDPTPGANCLSTTRAVNTTDGSKKRGEHLCNIIKIRIPPFQKVIAGVQR